VKAGIFRQLQWMHPRGGKTALLPKIKLLLLIGVIACFPCGAQNFPDPKTDATSDFDLKLSNNDILIRRKGTDNWEHSRDVKEPIQIELFDGSHAYLVTKAVKPPQPKYTPDADFPAQAKKQHKGGIVAVHAVVDERGTLRSISVYASSGPEFATNTLEALRKWIFDPARLNDQPVAVFLNITMNFRSSHRYTSFDRSSCRNQAFTLKIPGPGGKCNRLISTIDFRSAIFSVEEEYCLSWRASGVNAALS
jgi:TonB family protein